MKKYIPKEILPRLNIDSYELFDEYGPLHLENFGIEENKKIAELQRKGTELLKSLGLAPEQDFSDKYHHKIVKLLGNHYKLPIKEYLVTSALLDWDLNGETIFSIKALDYTLENKHWFSLRIAKEEFDVCMADFEIV